MARRIMALLGLSCRQISGSLNVAETKATQAWAKPVRKVATMLLDHPVETCAELAGCMREIAEERERAEADELADLEARIEGRAGQRGTRCEARPLAR